LLHSQELVEMGLKSTDSITHAVNISALSMVNILSFRNIYLLNTNYTKLWGCKEKLHRQERNLVIPTTYG
jgi:hypothetical protein